MEFSSKQINEHLKYVRQHMDHRKALKLYNRFKSQMKKDLCGANCRTMPDEFAAQ